MPRTAVVTGAASGIGRATRELLEQWGELVIGVDLHDTDVVADLSDPRGRAALVEGVRGLAGAVDSVYAVAGLASPAPATVAVNFFGSVATLEGLRPLLLSSPARARSWCPPWQPCCPAMRSSSACSPPAANRPRFAKEPETTGQLIYSATKLALSRSVRRHAAAPEWAEASIPLNAVASGIIATPMTAGLIATDQGREALLEAVPMPLNGIAEPIVVARALAWLGSEENTHLCGQVVYVDGGSDVVLRGDAVW